MKFHAALVAGALVVCTTAAARATDLSGHFAVDNEFGLYLSTDDSVLGDPVAYIPLAGTWEDVRTFTVTLTPGVVQYLHVVATDTGGDGDKHAMFLGDFSLSDNGFTFGNGTQWAVTGSDWKVSKTGFVDGFMTPFDFGTNENDNQPWGDRDGISTDAHFIWSDTQATGYEEQDWATVYFSLPVFPNAGETPEPTTLALLALGGVPLLLKRRRHA